MLCTEFGFPVSPKFHFQMVGVPVEPALLNCTVSGTHPDLGVAINAATGQSMFTKLVTVFVSLQPAAFVTVNVVEKFPQLLYKTSGGLLLDQEDCVQPGKLHEYVNPFPPERLL